MRWLFFFASCKGLNIFLSGPISCKNSVSVTDFQAETLCASNLSVNFLETFAPLLAPVFRMRALKKCCTVNFTFVMSHRPIKTIASSDKNTQSVNHHIQTRTLTLFSQKMYHSYTNVICWRSSWVIYGVWPLKWLLASVWWKIGGVSITSRASWVEKPLVVLLVERWGDSPDNFPIWKPVLDHNNTNYSVCERERERSPKLTPPHCWFFFSFLTM